MDGHSDTPHFAQQRQHMVQSQLADRDIVDAKILKTFGRVLRHCFVPPAQRDQAYADHPLPIGAGQTISQPYVVAYMLQALDLSSNARVLEIGTGSGYQTAILAELAATVFTVEFFPELAHSARRALAALNYINVDYKTGDGTLGWVEKAPFDAIIGSAAAVDVPSTLVDQLAVGGRMILPVGDGRQHLVLLEHTEEHVEHHTLLPVRFVPMQTG
tara:strand:- start:641 stop:1285 length:645 start_codon:yes stop_codon:yes gene_type:complete